MGTASLATPGRACAACDYALHLDLPEKVCPECGRPFSFLDPSTTFPAGPAGSNQRLRRDARRVLSTWPVLLFLTAGAMWFFSLLGPLAWLCVLPPLVPLARRRWGVTLTACLVSPFAASIVFATLRYASGTGYVMTVGLITPPGPYLDHDLRCPVCSSGCLVHENEWVWQGSNNLAMRTLTRVFGPQRGSYAGAFPDDDAADRATKAGTVIPFADLAADRVTIDGKTLSLPLGTASRLMPRGTSYCIILAMYSGGLSVKDDLQELGPIRAAAFEPGCLAVRLPEEQHRYTIFLVDVSTGAVFAMYSGQER